jgi:hypothetical protein
MPPGVAGRVPAGEVGEVVGGVKEVPGPIVTVVVVTNVVPEPAPVVVAVVEELDAIGVAKTRASDCTAVARLDMPLRHATKMLATPSAVRMPGRLARNGVE